MIPNPPVSVTRFVLTLVLVSFALAVCSPGTAQTKGTFRAAIDYSAGPATVPSNTGFLLGGILPLEVHSGDFNGDGKPDLALAVACNSPAGGSYGYPGCSASGYPVAVYLSNGDGTFQTAILNGGPAPGLRSIAVGDFNGDGKLDVVAASDCLSDQDCSSGTMVILLGNGDGTLTGTAVTYALNGIVSQHRTLAVGDFNGDGKPDIAAGVTCYNIPVNLCSVGAVEIYLGNGDGSFSDPTIYTTVGNSALYPVVGDFNGDGKLDVIAGSPSNLTILLGVGDGSFSETVTTLPFYALEALAAADLNGDGRLDLAIGTIFTSGLQVMNGNGDGTFQDPVAYPLTANVAETVIAKDMNADGKPDLIIGGTQGGIAINSATVLLNDGFGNFNNNSIFYLGGWNDSTMAVADFNGDGKNDIMLASFEAEDNNSGSSDGTLSVLLGNGDGTMRSARYLPEGADIPRPSVGAADFNGDGLQDLIYPSGCGAGASCTPSGFTLLLADGTGGYQAPLVFTAPVKQSRFLAVADFNGDGKQDVAVFNDCNDACTGSSVSIFLNRGNGTFLDPVVYESGGVTPVTIVTGDFNGDGKLDIALLQFCGTCNDGSNAIGILFGHGDGSFQPVVATPAAPSNSIAPAELNGDGKTDLVLAALNPGSSAAGMARILISNGDGSFTPGAEYDTGGRYPTVTTGDLNHDGKTDIVLANGCDPITGDVNCARGTIRSLLGNGDGTFTSGATYVIPDASMGSPYLADVNADGKLDLVAATTTGIPVFLGNGDGSFLAPTIYAALENVANPQLAIADLNNDGGLDIVQPGNNGQLAILYSQGFSFPIASLTPVTLTFPNQLVGTPSTAKLVTLSNTGTALMHITSIVAGGDFTIVSNTCGATLTVSAKCKVKVTFTPSAPGTVTGQLAFTDDAPSIHQIVPLTGTGVLPATLSPTDVIYPSRKVGTISPPKAFNLTNNQNVALTNIAISSTGDFAVSSTTCTASLPSKGKCKINVTFHPTATGLRTGQLIVSDSATNSPQTANLTGTGK